MTEAILEKDKSIYSEDRKYKVREITLDGEEYYLLPQNSFSKVDLLEMKMRKEYGEEMIDSQEYPRLYAMEDEEWLWETIDFWSEWISQEELILIHKELWDDR